MIILLKSKIYILDRGISMKKISLYIYLFCSISPCIIAIVMFFFLPDLIPAHMAAGDITRYGNKAEVFIVPIANVIVLLLFKCFFWFIYDISSEKTDKTLKIIQVSSICINVTFFGLCVWYFCYLCSITFT